MRKKKKVNRNKSVVSVYKRGENTEAGSRNLLQIFLIALKNVHALHCGFLTVYSNNYA